MLALSQPTDEKVPDLYIDFMSNLFFLTYSCFLKKIQFKNNRFLNIILVSFKLIKKNNFPIFRPKVSIKSYFKRGHTNKSLKEAQYKCYFQNWVIIKCNLHAFNSKYTLYINDSPLSKSSYHACAWMPTLERLGIWHFWWQTLEITCP